MPRAPRIEFAGAVYHVMNRGNHLEPIFRDDQDRAMLMQVLDETCVSSEWLAHSFVFMSNHYHLLIETRRPNLVKGMQYLNATYTRRYNVRHKTFGHLFQGRYKALLVDVENPGYFLTVSDYVHMNPARGRGRRVHDLKGLLKDPWSSVGWLAGSRKGRPHWLRWERVYGELGLKGGRSAARREFRKYMGRRVNEVMGSDEKENHQRLKRSWCWGSEDFVGQMKERLEKLSQKPRNEESWNDVAMEELERERAKRLLKAGVQCLGYASDGTVKGWDRFLLGRWVRRHSKVNVKWLADRFGLKTRGGMSNGIYLMNKQMLSNRKMVQQWRRLESL